MVATDGMNDEQQRLFDELFVYVGVESGLTMLEVVRDYLVPDSPPARMSKEQARKCLRPMIEKMVESERARIRELRTGVRAQ